MPNKGFEGEVVGLKKDPTTGRILVLIEVFGWDGEVRVWYGSRDPLPKLGQSYRFTIEGVS